MLTRYWVSKMTNSPVVKPEEDALHLFMRNLERIEGLPSDVRHHTLFMVAVLVGKVEGQLGLPEISISHNYDLVLTWNKLQVIISPTASEEPMFTVGSIEGLWAYVVQTPMEVAKLLEEMNKFGVPELPPERDSVWTKFKNYITNTPSKAPKVVVGKI